MTDPMNPTPGPAGPAGPEFPNHAGPGHRSAFTPKLVFGIALILAGIAFTLDNLNLIDASRVLNFWPVLIILWGFAKLWQDGLRYGGGGLVVVAVGTFFLLVTLGHGNLADAFAPMGLVAFGIWMVMRALGRSRPKPERLENPEGYVQGTAIFSGVKRRVVSQDFRGGELTAIFGGFDVDLRRAGSAGGEMRLDVFTMFGGGEIKVPENWVVVSHATALFGGIGDKTQERDAVPPPPGSPCLVLTGIILFGGLEIRH